jgi:hypothetical protein
VHAPTSGPGIAGKKKIHFCDVAGTSRHGPLQAGTYG